MSARGACKSGAHLFGGCKCETDAPCCDAAKRSAAQAAANKSLRTQRDELAEIVRRYLETGKGMAEAHADPLEKIDVAARLALSRVAR